MKPTRYLVPLLVVLTACATAAVSPPAVPPSPAAAPATPVAPESAWLDSLDDRYVAFDRSLALASWQRAVGEEPVADTTQAERAQGEFFSDDLMRSRLRRNAGGADPALAGRARAWLRFLDRDRLESDPKVKSLNERIRKAMDGDGSGEPAIELAKTIIFTHDPDAHRAALAEISRRSRHLVPPFLKRAQRLDEIAREMGALDAATLVAGPNALESLEATCRAQVERTAKDWDALLVTLEQRLGRPAELSDYAGATSAWTRETGAFFTPDEIGPLAESAFKRMGFDVRAMKIDVRVNPKATGGSAYAISIPDDVRFQGNFTQPGFDMARGYFHELGHAVHMKMVRAPRMPARQLPQDRALSEGVAEIFALIPRDPQWIGAAFPKTSAEQRAQFDRSARAFDAMAVRVNCLQARLEQELYARADIAERWPVIYEQTFGSKAPIGPTWLLLVPAYLETPFYLRSYVYQAEVRDTFVRRLDGRPLLSPEAGAMLAQTLLAPGNALTLDAYLREPGASAP